MIESKVTTKYPTKQPGRLIEKETYMNYKKRVFAYFGITTHFIDHVEGYEYKRNNKSEECNKSHI